MSSDRLEELQRAEGLIRDAERCKLLLPALHEAAAPRSSDSGAGSDPLQLRLVQLAVELESFLAAQTAASLTAMVGRAAEACPTLLAPGSVQLTELQAGFRIMIRSQWLLIRICDVKRSLKMHLNIFCILQTKKKNKKTRNSPLLPVPVLVEGSCYLYHL